MKINPIKYRKYASALQKNKLLQNLREDQISGLLENIEEEVWPKHTCLLDSIKTLSKFYFVISGRLKVFKVDPETDRELTLFILTKNDVFDILCLLEEQEHEVVYETLDKVVLLSASMQNMHRWVREIPEINRNMLPYLGHHLKIMEEYASNITLINISTRLAKLILSNINSKSHKLELINDLSNEELANLVGSTRAVVNRHLQEFKNDGILHLGRQKVEIRNLQLLLQKARFKI